MAHLYHRVNQVHLALMPPPVVPGPGSSSTPSTATAFVAVNSADREQLTPKDLMPQGEFVFPFYYVPANGSTGLSVRNVEASWDSWGDPIPLFNATPSFEIFSPESSCEPENNPADKSGAN